MRLDGYNSLFTSGFEEVAKNYAICAAKEFRMRYETATETLEMKWLKHPSPEQIMYGYEMAMELVQKYKPKKWFVDLHNRHFISRDEKKWLFQVFLKEALAAIKQDVFVALILPVYTFDIDVTHTEMDGNDLMLNNNFIIIQHCMYEEAVKDGWKKCFLNL